MPSERMMMPHFHLVLYAQKCFLNPCGPYIWQVFKDLLFALYQYKLTIEGVLHIGLLYCVVRTETECIRLNVK